MPRREIIWLLALTGLSLIVLALTGGFHAEITPDTASYLNVGPFPAALAQTRVPLYGPLIAMVDNGSRTFAAVPVLQTAFFIIAAWLLVFELRRFGLSGLAVLSVAAALLFSNSLLLIGRTVHPELPAIACALLAFAGTVRLSTPNAPRWAAVLVLLGAGLAYLLRPSFLPLIFVLPVLHAGLRALRGERPFTAGTGAILVAAALPFLAMASLRAATVGDFNIVSYGGYQMSGMATLMLSEPVVARLPERDRALGARLLAARNRRRRNRPKPSACRAIPRTGVPSCRRRSPISTSMPAPTTGCCRWSGRSNSRTKAGLNSIGA